MIHTLTHLTQLIAQTTEQLYSREEQRFLCRRLCEQIAPGSYALRLADPQRAFTESQWNYLEKACEQLGQGRPVQYVLGESEFYGLTLKVAEGVLIPRPETEELVEWISESVGPHPVHLLDIGVGSGAISLALAATLPQGSQIEGWDLSNEALRIANENMQSNQLKNVKFLSRDVLTYQPSLVEYGQLDVIVSNPPYVMESEKSEMKPHVLDFEPALALFVTDHDPLIFYRTISQLALRLLKPGGSLFFEINSLLGKETLQLVSSLGFEEVELRKDLNGKDRMIKARKK